jgi:hypothetical protein
MTEQTYITVLKNERKIGVVLWDHRGQGMEILGPGQSTSLETWNPETLFAPFSEVIYKEDGTIVTVPNPEFPAPKSRWLLTAINLDGREMERRVIAGREVALPKGLARTFELDLADRLIGYQRLEIRNVIEREPHALFPGYLVRRQVPKDILIDRSEAELEEIRVALEEALKTENADAFKR